MKVTNLTSPRSGCPVANQFHIVDDHGVQYFQSYSSVIAKREKGVVTLDEHYHDYSVTTIKYRNQWLGCSSKEVKAKIESGEFKLGDLN